MESYAIAIERELTRARELRGEVEATFGRSLTSVRTTDPKVYAEKKAAWEAHLKEKEATERKRTEARQAAIDQWQRERRSQQREQESRAKERQQELLLAAEKQKEEENARVAKARAEQTDKMNLWHGKYRARVGGVKAALGQVLSKMEKNDSTNLNESCRQLNNELKGIDGKSSVLDSPDPTASRHLREAYLHMRALAANCMQGRMAEVQKELDSTKKDLGMAAQALAVYELRP